MTSAAPRCMHTARESMARRVLVMEYARIASAIPGTSRSQTARVASGVTSRIESPAGDDHVGLAIVGRSHNGSTDLVNIVMHHRMRGNHPALRRDELLEHSACLVLGKIARIRARHD